MSERSYQAWAVAIVVLLSVASLVPLLYVLSSSLVNEQEWNEKGGFILWPDHPTLLAYKQIFASSTFLNAMGVSIRRAMLGTALTLSLTTVTAYIVSRRGMPGRKTLLAAILVTIMFGGGLIPTYLVVRDLHLLDSIWALVIPGLRGQLERAGAEAVF